MFDISEKFNKSDDRCSNIYLIDENLCLSDSIDVINSNFINLSTCINQINKTGDYLNQIYTYFTIQSSLWIEGNNNLTKNTNKWNDDYTLVNTLSSMWANEFSLFYTKIFEIKDYYNSEQTGDPYSLNEILTWLSVNFPPNSFADGQIISVYVNLYEDYSFDITNGFKATHTHQCSPPPRSGTKTCTKCPSPSRGCNHHGGEAGNGPCTNAYDDCSVQVTGGPVTYACTGNGPITKTIGPQPVILLDRFIARSIRLRYKKNNNVWSKLPNIPTNITGL